MRRPTAPARTAKSDSSLEATKERSDQLLAQISELIGCVTEATPGAPAFASPDVPAAHQAYGVALELPSIGRRELSIEDLRAIAERARATGWEGTFTSVVTPSLVIHLLDVIEGTAAATGPLTRAS